MPHPRARRLRPRAHALGSCTAVLGTIVTSLLAVGPAEAATPAAPLAASSPYSLAGVCPSTITVQTDWDPAIGNDFDWYELESPHGTVDANSKSYTGELIAHGHDTGVKLQLLAGGKVVDYESGGQLMAQHPNILLADDSTDTDIEVSTKAEMIDLVSDFNNSALEIMWSPHTYPSVKRISDLAKTKAVVLYSEGSPYMTYLVDKGVLRASQTSPSYTGSAAQYIAAAGADAQQGYETAQQFPNPAVVPADLRALRYQPISAYGYDPYQNGIGTLPSYVQKYAACFKKLVPIIQQAGIDYFAHPAAANKLVVRLVAAYNDGWAYTMADAVYAEKKMVADKIVGNGAGGVFGAESPARINQMIKILDPILAREGTPAKAGLTASQLYTGRFLDPSIHFKA